MKIIILYIMNGFLFVGNDAEFHDYEDLTM